MSDTDTCEIEERHPETRAQVKDKSASRARKILIQNFFKYVQITTTGDIDLKGQSTKDWPSVKVLLVILDGFKPKRLDGGRRKKGSERRVKPMIALISESENVCGDVLHAIDEGVVYNYSSRYEPRFAYNSSEAISYMTDVMYENSPDENEEKINDSVSTQIRALLINRLYSYISMTTPKNVDKRNKSTADWPQLKVGLFIVDECKPNLSSGAAYSKGKERREKTLVTLMTGSENDRKEIIDALGDGILSGNEIIQSHYDPVFAYNVDDAVKTEYFGFEPVLSRPPERVLRLEEILPTIKHLWICRPIQGSVDVLAGEDTSSSKDIGRASYEGPPITALDIRVGRIQRVWEHEEAEKLFCEEIDIGEDQHRMVASGLRPFFQKEDFEGRKVLVLCNLKERKLDGFPSYGMVLCASNSDYTDVRFISPPVDAKVGERITVPGWDVEEPMAENELAKKKVFEQIAPFLKTSQHGVPEFLGSPFMTSAGVCTSPLPNASVS